jgi:hypothetical protein
MLAVEAAVVVLLRVLVEQVAQAAEVLEDAIT